ncbi:TlpA family protein disulfide reductase [Pseudothauera nasutitermitis]|uniref:TlpA family protein disulfide reductase n=1 Tax=Pseudothauera nasutitermitis TaxID=2565930 RepID=A0A4S4AQ05_9RHOO|nr:TlpA disulfide reductase family protein [Pseudothauera nasutitermitis]THF61806.1 TlpA family protein disulfide reductase [Pseudothauera nasutitermitis]
MKKWITLATLATLAALSGGCKEEVARSGLPAPEIAAVDLQGEPVKLAHWQGRSIFLNFWSTTCGACLAEMPHLEALSREYRGRVEVVAINVDPEGMSIQETLDKQGVSFPVIRDSLGMTQERYQVMGTPTSFVIGADGVLRQSFVGAPPRERLAEVFAEAARGS